MGWQSDTIEIPQPTAMLIIVAAVMTGFYMVTWAVADEKRNELRQSQIRDLQIENRHIQRDLDRLRANVVALCVEHEARCGAATLHLE